MSHYFFSIFFSALNISIVEKKGQSMQVMNIDVRDGQIQFSLKTGQLLDGFIHHLNMNICSLIWTADNVVVGL